MLSEYRPDGYSTMADIRNHQPVLRRNLLAGVPAGRPAVPQGFVCYLFYDVIYRQPPVDVGRVFDCEPKLDDMGLAAAYGRGVERYAFKNKKSTMVHHFTFLGRCFQLISICVLKPVCAAGNVEMILCI